MADDSPYTTGGIGLLGTEPSQDALEGCDTLLMVGTSFPYIEFYPEAGQARARCRSIWTRCASGCAIRSKRGLVGDCGKTLRALIPLLKRKDNRGFLEKAQAGMKEWRELMMHARPPMPACP